MERYELVRQIGKGSFGSVWLATRRSDGAQFVVKKLPLGSLSAKNADTALASYENEVKLLSQLEHPGIVSLIESFTEETVVFTSSSSSSSSSSRPSSSSSSSRHSSHQHQHNSKPMPVQQIKERTMWIVMAYCEGGDLSHFLESRKKLLAASSAPSFKFFLPEKEIWYFFIQMTLALKFMHDSKILHRDLKTANIFLKNGLIQLGDFGISKILEGPKGGRRRKKQKQRNAAASSRNGDDEYEDDESAEIDQGDEDEDEEEEEEDVNSFLTSTCIGTPYYMSPELFQGVAYGFKSDVWALGCVLYELTTFRHAFDSSSLPLLASKIQKGLLNLGGIRSEYSNELKSLIGAMLSVSPRARPSIRDILAMPFIKLKLQKFVHAVIKNPHFYRDRDVKNFVKQIISLGYSDMLKIDPPPPPPASSSSSSYPSSSSSSSSSSFAHLPSSSSSASASASAISSAGSANAHDPSVPSQQRKNRAMELLREEEKERAKMEDALSRLKAARSRVPLPSSSSSSSSSSAASASAHASHSPSLPPNGSPVIAGTERRRSSGKSEQAFISLPPPSLAPSLFVSGSSPPASYSIASSSSSSSASSASQAEARRLEERRREREELKRREEASRRRELARRVEADRERLRGGEQQQRERERAQVAHAQAVRRRQLHEIKSKQERREVEARSEFERMRLERERIQRHLRQLDAAPSLSPSSSSPSAPPSSGEEKEVEALNERDRQLARKERARVEQEASESTRSRPAAAAKSESDRARAAHVNRVIAENAELLASMAALPAALSPSVAASAASSSPPFSHAGVSLSSFVPPSSITPSPSHPAASPSSPTAATAAAPKAAQSPLFLSSSSPAAQAEALEELEAELEDYDRKLQTLKTALQVTEIVDTLSEDEAETEEEEKRESEQEDEEDSEHAITAATPPRTSISSSPTSPSSASGSSASSKRSSNSSSTAKSLSSISSQTVSAANALDKQADDSSLPEVFTPLAERTKALGQRASHLCGASIFVAAYDYLAALHESGRRGEMDEQQLESELSKRMNDKTHLWPLIDQLIFMEEHLDAMQEEDGEEINDKEEKNECIE